MALPIILFAFTACLLMGLALPLMRRRVKPNALYGLRVRSTFADEWVWYEANARSGRDLLVLGAVQLVLALGLPLLPGMREEAYTLALTAFLTIGTIVFAILGTRRANRLLRERREGGAGT